MTLDILFHGNGNMYICIYSLWFKVECIFSSIEDTNDFLAKHPECGVITDEGKVVVVARNDDEGCAILPEIKYNKYGEVITK